MTGRPRDTELESRLLAAAWALLQTDGYDALTLTRVATTAGAHRSDVYRRWSTKAQLVADALAAHLPDVADEDRGSLLGDLEAHVARMAEVWSAPWADGLMGLVADLQRDVDAELAFRQMAVSRGGALRAILERAATRGEVAPGAELGLVSDLLEGALMHRRLIGREPLPAELLRSLASSVHLLLTRTGVRA